MVPALKNKTYEERLVALGLTKLVERRIRGDIPAGTRRKYNVVLWLIGLN